MSVDDTVPVDEDDDFKMEDEEEDEAAYVCNYLLIAIVVFIWFHINFYLCINVAQQQ